MIAAVPRAPCTMPRIVLTTFGSLGDLHPTVAIALGLKARGHEAIVATSDYYRGPIERLGLGFLPLRPDWPSPADEAAFVRRFMDVRCGPGRLICDFMMPALRQSHSDTLAAAAGADLLLAHPLTFCTRLAAEQLGIPWVSSHLFPMSLFSIFDPSLVPLCATHFAAAFSGAEFFPLCAGDGQAPPASLERALASLAGRAGLRAHADPLFDGAYSPQLVLALFSPLLASPQPDWPRQTVVTGFPLYDRAAGGLPPELARFLDQGPPPIVFTLGSAAVLAAGRFFADSVAAAQLLGRRAVLLTGSRARTFRRRCRRTCWPWAMPPSPNFFPGPRPSSITAGSARLARPCRAGRPMLVMPFSYDQPDNARRAARLGVARVISHGATRPRGPRLTSTGCWARPTMPGRRPPSVRESARGRRDDRLRGPRSGAPLGRSFRGRLSIRLPVPPLRSSVGPSGDASQSTLGRL